ncbi:unnamed protein product, partial [Rhizoctonia solani]
GFPLSGSFCPEGAQRPIYFELNVQQRDTFRPALHHTESTVTPKPSYGASTQLFRRLVWESTIPLEIRTDSKEPLAEAILTLISDSGSSDFLPLYDHYQGARSLATQHDPQSSLLTWTTGPKPRAVPLKLLLHLANAPTENLLLGSGVDACKAAFMGQLKEGDLGTMGKHQAGHSVTKGRPGWNLGRNNFDDFWKISGRIFPTTSVPSAQAPSTPHHSSTALHRPSSTGVELSEQNAAHAFRSIPIRVVLPDGPVLQDQVPPTNPNGGAMTLGEHLRVVMPLLFGKDEVNVRVCPCFIEFF